MALTFDEDKQNRKLDELRLKEEEDLVQLLSAKYGVEYINLVGTPVNSDALRLIKEEDARKALVAGFALVDKRVKIAVRNPESEATKNVTDNLTNAGYIPEIYIASKRSLEKAWLGYKDLSFARESRGGSLEISNEEITNIIKESKGLEDIINIINDLIGGNKSYRVSRILETIIAGALAIDASDVHLEPEEKYVRLRYRLDGVLQEVIQFDNETYALLLSRIKLIAGMKLNIKKDSQDGRFSIRLDVGDIEVRASVLPGAYNESVVLRILNPKTIDIPLEDLGINKKLLAVLENEISRPDGMILTTGPTGSGKTTTLYAFLKKVHNPTVKIITIEDPIEYHLPGIVQTQVNDKGYNFIEGLRAAVRQDPDIIMIGEIRDNETASIAVNSALTGHLVFSTLHTNDAAGTFPRLSDLGVNPSITPSALRVSMAQRLVRKLCEYCKAEAVVDGEAKNEIDATIATVEDQSLVPPDRTKMWVSKGCPKCNNTGYKGRIGIYEAILMNENIEHAVQSGSSDREIWLAAKGQGILTMKQDGILKVLSGVTSIEELQRVISIED